jgi:hypothetical protein
VVERAQSQRRRSTPGADHHRRRAAERAAESAMSFVRRDATAVYLLLRTSGREQLCIPAPEPCSEDVLQHPPFMRQPDAEQAGIDVLLSRSCLELDTEGRRVDAHPCFEQVSTSKRSRCGLRSSATPEPFPGQVRQRLEGRILPSSGDCYRNPQKILPRRIPSGLAPRALGEKLRSRDWPPPPRVGMTTPPGHAAHHFPSDCSAHVPTKASRENTCRFQLIRADRMWTLIV